MAVIVAPGTKYSEEVLKHEFDDFRIGTERGKRGPRVFQEFPKMVYKAGRNGVGKIEILEHFVVGDAHEQRNLESRGFCETQEGALEAFQAEDRDLAKLAANRAYQERTMSDAARAEAQAYELAQDDHVAEIPVAPKKRGRPAKTE
jgi:hypothetical protein